MMERAACSYVESRAARARSRTIAATSVFAVLETDSMPLRLFCFVAVGLATSVVTADEAVRPNVVIILTDDMWSY